MKCTQHHATTAQTIVWVYSEFTSEAKKMNRSYLTEDAKLIKMVFPRWSAKDCETIRETLYTKGYFTNCVLRIGSDGKYHDALQVEREDVPQLVEQLFRQRLVAEYQAEGNYKASINFVYDYAAETIIDAVRRFQNRRD